MFETEFHCKTCGHIWNRTGRAGHDRANQFIKRQGVVVVCPKCKRTEISFESHAVEAPAVDSKADSESKPVERERMRKSFVFDADSVPNSVDEARAGILNVWITVECQDPTLAEVSFVLEGLDNLETGLELRPSDLNIADRARLLSACQAHAKSYAQTAYELYTEGATDQAYESWRDEQILRENE